MNLFSSILDLNAEDKDEATNKLLLGFVLTKKWEKGAEIHLCFHLKTLVDSKQGCSISLSAVQGVPVNLFPPPASSAHPGLLERSHRAVTNVPVCSKVPWHPSSPAPSLFPQELW